MRRSAVALILALTMFMSVPMAGAQGFPEAVLWQDTERASALQKMILAGQRVCMPPGGQTPTAEQPRDLPKEFIDTVRPLIRSTLAGVYGSDIPFWLEKITHVQALKKYPNEVLRAVIEVQTYEGAHNPYGVDTIEFQLVPGPHLYVSRVEHRQHPEARPRQ